VKGPKTTETQRAQQRFLERDVVKRGFVSRDGVPDDTQRRWRAREPAMKTGPYEWHTKLS
jgi:hypothetical protein